MRDRTRMMAWVFGFTLSGVGAVVAVVVARLVILSLELGMLMPYLN